MAIEMPTGAPTSRPRRCAGACVGVRTEKQCMCNSNAHKAPTNRPRPTGEMTEGPDGETDGMTDDGMTEDPNGVTGGG